MEKGKKTTNKNGNNKPIQGECSKCEKSDCTNCKCACHAQECSACHCKNCTCPNCGCSPCECQSTNVALDLFQIILEENAKYHNPEFSDLNLTSKTRFYIRLYELCVKTSKGEKLGETVFNCLVPPKD